MACLLWENQFYEHGVEISGRMHELVPKVAPERVAAMAVEARSNMKLRHAPLLLVREMARHASHRSLVGETLAQVVQRADELTEFVAIYRKDGRVPLSKQVKSGLAWAFGKSTSTRWQSTTGRGLSTCATCCSLCTPSLAMRHRRSFGSGWSKASWRRRTRGRSHSQAEPTGVKRGSAYLLSEGSGCWLSFELAEDVAVFSFSDDPKRIPARRGFALRDAIDSSQPHGGTALGKAVAKVAGTYDRLIVITDEQAQDWVPAPTSAAYVINVASYKNGVGYGRWIHIDGWSEAVIDYIRSFESVDWIN
jgi:hypothetical protein